MPAHRLRNISVGLVSAVALVAVGWEAASLVSTPDQANIAKAVDPRITAQVTAGSLEAQATGTGTIKVGKSLDVVATAPEGRRPVVSAKPLGKGDAVRWCYPIVEVAGRPIIALKGAVPAYRDLASGDTGGDVRQLQNALAECGIYRGKADGKFGGATEQAVSLLYRNAGYDTETSAQPEVPTSDPTQGAGGAPASPGTTAPSIVTVPAGELAFLPEQGEIRSVAGLGTSPADSPVVTIALSGNIAELAVDPLVATKLRPGSRVAIRVGDGGAIQAKLPPLPDAPTQRDGADPVYIVDVPMPEGAKGVVAGADVTYSIQTGSDKNYSTIVPTTALYESTDGTSFVLRSQGDVTTTVPVAVVETAGGFAAVRDEKGTLVAGDRVVVGANHQ